MKIGSKKVCSSNRVFVIAEAGVNHNNKLSLAYKMIDLAAKSGADAIKFQSFITDNMQLRESTKPKYQNSLSWSYYEQLKKSESSFDFQIKLIKYCKRRKLMFLSTPYDEESVDFLVSQNIPAFKISSSDITNHLFLRYIAKQRKPIILSTGLSTFQHVDMAVNLLKKLNMKNKLILLQATSDYPTPFDEVNLRVISEYKQRYNVPVGLSDHTIDYTASLGAVALGACVLEKHFTLSKKLSGPDQTSSLSPTEFTTWIKKVRIMEEMLGSKTKFITKCEIPNLTMRKILVMKPAEKGTKISKDLLVAKRGNINGILPLEKNLKKIIGKRLVRDIHEEGQFSWNMISK